MNFQHMVVLTDFKENVKKMIFEQIWELYFSQNAKIELYLIFI